MRVKKDTKLNSKEPCIKIHIFKECKIRPQLPKSPSFQSCFRQLANCGLIILVSGLYTFCFIKLFSVAPNDDAEHNSGL